MAAIARSENRILARIDSSTADLNTKIDVLQDDVAKQETRLGELESGLNTYSGKTANAENEVAMLKGSHITPPESGRNRWGTLLVLCTSGRDKRRS